MNELNLDPEEQEEFDTLAEYQQDDACDLMTDYKVPFDLAVNVARDSECYFFGDYGGDLESQAVCLMEAVEGSNYQYDNETLEEWMSEIDNGGWSIYTGNGGAVYIANY